MHVATSGTAAVEEITPDIALRYLERNVSNRKLNKDRVKALAQMMRDGQFILTHQGIALDENGDVVDGQHRLWGIVEADVTVKMWVHHGVPAESMAFVDNGLPRDDAGGAVIIGMKWVDKGYVAVARKMSEGMLTNNNATRMNRAQLFDFLNRHQNALMFARCSARNASILAAVARAYYLNAPACPTISREKLERFMHVVSTGVSDGQKESAAVVLRNWISAHRMGMNGATMRIEIYKRTENNLVAFLNEEPRKQCFKTDAEQFFLPEETAKFRVAI